VVTAQGYGRHVHRRRFIAASAGAMITAGLQGCDTTPTRPRRVPDPTGVLVTRWATDPFSLGSYSFLAVGARPRDRRSLTAASGRRLWLAGEHTSVDHPAMTHGAVESGRRAAAQVLDAIGTTPPTLPVVIVGAGLSGLAAAERLRAAAVPVVVIEGRDRIGGRTVTDHSLGVPVDLGAAWIHGTTGNTMSTLVRATGGTWRESDSDAYATIGPDGRSLSTAESDAVWRDVRRAVRRSRDSWEEDADSPVSRWTDPLLDEMGRRRRLLVRLELERTLEHEFGGSIDRLSAWEHDEGAAIRGPEVLLESGHAPVVRHLARGVDVRLSSRVDRIEHSATGVRLSVAGRGGVEGSAAICTVPLGVLQAGGLVIDPPLPQPQRMAISRIGMGNLDKVVFRFPRRFWPDVDYLGITQRNSRFIEWVPLHRVVGAPVIVGFTAADAARELATLDDVGVAGAALSALRAAFP
jgi:monoamine oxidase